MGGTTFQATSSLAPLSAKLRKKRHRCEVFLRGMGYEYTRLRGQLRFRVIDP